MSSWSFAGIGFELLDDDDGTSPDWLRDPIFDARHLLGTGTTEYNLLGYTPWTLEAVALLLPDPADPTYDPTDAYDALRGHGGLTGTLINPNGQSFTAILVSNKIRPIVSGVVGYTGAVVFVRPTA